MPKSPAFLETILCLGALVAACACSSGGGDTPGAGGAPFMSAGGAVVGGMPSGGVGVGGGGAGPGPGGGGMMVGMAGAQSVPAGMLMCQNKLCKGGGKCNAMDGSCPAFLGTCFSSADKLESCDAYCGSIGAQCAAKSCNSDGTATSIGYSWVSYPAAGRASCQMSGVPATNSFDTCNSPIWLSPTKPQDDVIRCCCKG